VWVQNISIPTTKDSHCVVPENIHTCTSSTDPSTPLEIPIKHHTILQIFWSCKTIPPCPLQEIPNPTVGGVWISSGTAL